MRGIQKKIPLILLLLLVAGCAGPLQVNYNVAPPEEPGELDEPITILVTPFIDARGATADPLVIGDISVLVSNMTDKRLVLEKNPAEIVTEAFQKELSMAGYTVVDGDNGEADYVLSGELRELRLDLGSRDEIAVEIFSRVSTKEGRVVWEGVKKESEDRFAGVMGNSRRTISNYISATLSKVIRKTIAKAGPRMTAAVAGPSYTPTPGPVQTPIPPGQGRLVISTGQPRVKVYLDGVYYGLTPTSIDIEPGVYELRLKQPGLKDYAERVAVREGRVTELESTPGNGEQ